MTVIIVRRNEFWALKMHLVGYGPLKRKKKEMKSHELGAVMPVSPPPLAEVRFQTWVFVHLNKQW